jgi:hypothetical protein
MLRIIIAFTVCLVSAAVLYKATAYTNHLQLPFLAVFALSALAIYSVVIVLGLPQLLITNILILLVAVFAGSILGTLIDNPLALVSFCITAAIVDLISSRVGVTARLSHAFQSGSSSLLSYLSLSYRTQKTPHPIIGIGDLIIMTAIYFSLRRAGHTGLPAFVAPLGGLLLALATGLIVGGIAALPFISATTIAFLALTHKQIQETLSAVRVDAINEENQKSG